MFSLHSFSIHSIYFLCSRTPTPLYICAPCERDAWSVVGTTRASNTKHAFHPPFPCSSPFSECSHLIIFVTPSCDHDRIPRRSVDVQQQIQSNQVFIYKRYRDPYELRRRGDTKSSWRLERSRRNAKRGDASQPTCILEALKHRELRHAHRSAAGSCDFFNHWKTTHECSSCTHVGVFCTNAFKRCL